MKCNLLVLGLFMLIFVSLGCVGKETATQPLIKKAGEEQTSSEIKSARLMIDSVNYSWIGYGSLIEGKEGAGAFYSIKIFVENTGNVPINPEYYVTISHDGNMIFSRNVNSSLLSSVPHKEKKRDDLMLFMLSIDEKGNYEINVNLRDDGSTEVLDSTSKIVNIGY